LPKHIVTTSKFAHKFLLSFLNQFTGNENLKRSKQSSVVPVLISGTL